MSAERRNEPRADLRRDGEAATLTLSGNWEDSAVPSLGDLHIPFPELSQLALDADALQAWDSRLIAGLLTIRRRAEAADCELLPQRLPTSVAALLSLASAVPPHQPPADAKRGLFSRQRIIAAFANIGDDVLDSLSFIGDLLKAVGSTLLGRSAMRLRDLVAACYRSGPGALGIIALTSVLVGMILAYLGAEQLRQFGAAIYVADLVAIGMLREMGALMTAVVMAGRTGAAYAAELSSMQSNEEIDAISTLGISPMEYLVVPRVIALCLTMPLLVIFADALGIIGGGLVAGGMGVSPLQYVNQLEAALAPSHFFVGMGKALVFALLIAIAGCRAGLQAGRSSEGVGKATTEAVVTAVVYLIIADAAANILCQQLGI